MIMVSFKTRRDKEKVLDKVRKMEESIAEIVDCLEDAQYEESLDSEYYERNYRQEDSPMAMSRYGYRRRMR